MPCFWDFLSTSFPKVRDQAWLVPYQISNVHGRQLMKNYWINVWDKNKNKGYCAFSSAVILKETRIFHIWKFLLLILRVAVTTFNFKWFVSLFPLIFQAPSTGYLLYHGSLGKKWIFSWTGIPEDSWNNITLFPSDSLHLIPSKSG